MGSHDQLTDQWEEQLFTGWNVDGKQIYTNIIPVNSQMTRFNERIKRLAQFYFENLWKRRFYFATFDDSEHTGKEKSQSSGSQVMSQRRRPPSTSSDTRRGSNKHISFLSRRLQTEG